MDSNVQTVRDSEGNLTVWVAGVKMLGQKNVQIVPSNDGSLTLIMGVPLSRVTMGEDTPTLPVETTVEDNVIYPAVWHNNSDEPIDH